MGTLIAGTAVQAQDPFNPLAPIAPAPMAEVFDEAELDQLLTDAGFEHKSMELAGGYKAFSIVVDHKGQQRTHFAGIDRESKTVIIVGAATDLRLDASKASVAQTREMLRIVNRMSPTFVAINDNDVFVLNRTFGYDKLTAKGLGEQVSKYRQHFDEVYLPVMRRIANEVAAAN